MQQIRNTRELRETISEGEREFRLILQGGLFSRKTIRLLPDGRIRVVNHIEETVHMLTARQLYSESTIGNAMKQGAFAASL
jgi:hypothetical protein